MTKDYRSNPLLRISYSLIAPLYDRIIERPMRASRQQSLDALPLDTAGRVLLSGVGTGLDLPMLPLGHHYTALDFNTAMLSQARARDVDLKIDWLLGDSMALPFADNYFDHIVLHLITAVVPEPQHCLSEAARTLKPGGTIILLDKFLRPQQSAPLRRLLTPVLSRIATRMDVVFEDILCTVPELKVVSDTPLLASGWFRAILLQKNASFKIRR
ncbi:MAG: class I SAM-dependent methyltransferase [Gallionella sp.]